MQSALFLQFSGGALELFDLFRLFFEQFAEFCVSPDLVSIVVCELLISLFDVFDCFLIIVD